MSKIRHNFHEDSEKLINKHINFDLHAAYCYRSKAAYFHRHNVALHNIYKYFEKLSSSHDDCARSLIKYLNKRGGVFISADIKAPEKDEWGSPLDAMQCALELEKQINQSLLDIITTAEKNNDYHLSDYIKDELLDKEIDLIKELGDKVTILKRVGPGLGEFYFDQHCC